MTKKELNEKRARSMARSMEAEGANYERMKKIILQGLGQKNN